MEKEPITSQGLEKIKKELGELKKIKRPKIIEAQRPKMMIHFNFHSFFHPEPLTQF